MSVIFQSPPQRILVRGVNWLGDAVMTTPALGRLREKFPAAHITLLCAEKICPLFEQHPAVNETIPFAKGDGVFAIAKKLRAGKFDLALVLPNSPRSALEVFAAGIPHRIGYARPWRNFFLTQTIASRSEAVKMCKPTVKKIRELLAADVNQRRMPIAPLAHQIHEYLHLAAALGANPQPLPPQLAVTLAEIAAAKEKFGLGKNSQPIMGLNPGAEYGPAKRWPVAKFISVAKEIRQRTDCTWILFGGKNDVAMTAQIESAIQHPLSATCNLAGKTSLRELMALLQLCRVVLTNDTGPMHVAAALGTPVVVPFGSTSPELTGPGLPGAALHHLLKSDAPCSPCFLRECPIDFRCMNDIQEERVIKAVIEAAKSSA
jgi:heptosyltransferase-2